RFRGGARRNGTAVTVAGLMAAVFLVGTAAVLWQAKLANEAEAARLADKDRHDRDLAKAIEDERRQHALDRAIETAFGGDLEKARKAIIEAQKAGVDADQAYSPNGLIHFQRGAWQAAIKEFQSSLALKPTVAAQAMLVSAAIHAFGQSGGNFTGIEFLPQALMDLRSMEPVTPEDYMCKG